MKCAKHTQVSSGHGNDKGWAAIDKTLFRIDECLRIYYILSKVGMCIYNIKYFKMRHPCKDICNEDTPHLMCDVNLQTQNIMHYSTVYM